MHHISDKILEASWTNYCTETKLSQSWFRPAGNRNIYFLHLKKAGRNLYAKQDGEVFSRFLQGVHLEVPKARLTEHMPKIYWCGSFFPRNFLRCLEVCCLLFCPRRSILDWDMDISIYLTPPGCIHKWGICPHSLSWTMQEVGCECSPCYSRWEKNQKQVLLLKHVMKHGLSGELNVYRDQYSCRSWETATTGAVRRTDQERNK